MQGKSIAFLVLLLALPVWFLVGRDADPQPTPDALAATGQVLAASAPAAGAEAGVMPQAPAGQVLRAAVSGVAFEARITDVDGRPVADAVFWLRDAGNVGGRFQPGPDGRITARLDVAPDALLRYRAEAPVHAPVTGEWRAGQGPLELVLQPAWEVSGRITDVISGAPIRDALVRFDRAAVRTDADGRYMVVGTMAGAGMWLRALAPGFEAASVLIESPAPRRIRRDLRLRAGQGLTFTVVDRVSGAPLPGVRITRAAMAPEQMVTDRDGRFGVKAVPGETLRLRFAADGYADLAWDWHPVDPDDDRARFVELVRPVWLRGVVVDAAGRGIPSAWVVATNTAMPHGRLDERDGNGSLRRYGIPLAMVDPGEPAPGGAPLLRVQHGRHHLGIQLGDLPRFALAADASDPGATVPRPLRGAITGADGSFVLAVFPQDAPYRLDAGAPGYRSLRVEGVDAPAAAQPAPLRLTLDRAGEVHGEVICNGEPWSRGYVAWSAAGREGGFAVPTKDGGYRLVDVPAGTVRIAAVDRWDGSLGEGAAVQVVPGESTRLDLAVTVPTVDLEGLVVGADGSPLAGIGITAHRYIGNSHLTRGVSDRAGRFRLQLEAGLRYDISAERGPLRWWRRGFLAGNEPLKLVLPEPVPVRFLPVDAVTGESLLSAGVRPRHGTVAWRPVGAGEYDYADLATEPGGVMVVTLPAGAADVIIDFSRDGYGVRRLDGLQVPAHVAGVEDGGRGPEPLRLAVARGVDVELTFTAAQELAGLHQDGVQWFLLEAGELSQIQGPFPQYGGGSNFHYSGGTHLWLASPTLSARWIGNPAAGTKTLRGLLPGSYTLRAFPDVVAFEPAWIQVGAEDLQVRVDWRRR